jgi:hypothetical protein
MATPTPSPSSREVNVTIEVDRNGTITVSPETFWVSEGKHEQVVWRCNSADPNNPHPHFTVDFEANGTPFYESQFSSLYHCSGLKKRTVLHGPKIYKYTIRIGDKTLDPGGGVQP